MDFCTSCGKPLAEGSAFCASCGAPRSSEQASGGDAVGATAAAPVTPTQSSPEAPAPLAPEAQSAEGAIQGKKSRKPVLLGVGAVVVVAALVVGLLFVFGVFKKDDKGSENPQAAVADLMSSVVSLDPSKALSLVSPGEVSGFSGLVEAANGPGPKAAIEKLKSKLTSMQGPDGSSMLPANARMAMAMLSGISTDDIAKTFKAVSVKFSNMTYTTTELGTDISNVTVTGGDITVALDKNKLPAQIKSLVDMGLASASSDVPSWANDVVSGKGHTWHIQDFLSDVTDQGQKLDAIVVKQDGRWYVSLYGTIAQHIYEAENHSRAQSGESALQSPDWSLYGNPPSAITAASPNDVPGNLAKAFNDRSVKEIFQNLPQNEVRALFPFVPVLQAAADEDPSHTTQTISVSDVQSTTTKTDGNLVRVIYTQGTASSTENGETQTVSVNNGCYTSDGDEQCVSSWPEFGQTLAGVFGIDKGIPITLQKVNGGYQLDPVASIVNPFADALANADKLADAAIQAVTYFQQQMEAQMSAYSDYGSMS